MSTEAQPDESPSRMKYLHGHKPKFPFSPRMATDWGPVRTSSDIHLNLKRWQDKIELESHSLADLSPKVHAKPAVTMKKLIRLDVNKVKKSSMASTSEAETSEAEHPRNFRDIVKTAMIVRNWMAPQNAYVAAQDPIVKETAVPSAIVPTNASQDSVRVLVDPHDTAIAVPSNSKIFFASIKKLPKLPGYLAKKIKYFTVDPNGGFYFFWTLLVFLGLLYNMLGMTIFIYLDVYKNFFKEWLFLNMFFDVIYFLDIVICSRTTYMLDGDEVTQLERLWRHYRMASVSPFFETFVIRDKECGNRIVLDFFCLIPLDFILLYSSSFSLVRTVRCFKLHRFFDFVELLVQHFPYPHGIKIASLLLGCYVLFHWNACVYFMYSLADNITGENPGAFGFSYVKVFDLRLPNCDIGAPMCLMDEDTEGNLDLDLERPKYPELLYNHWKNQSRIIEMGNFSREYSMSMYWSALTITTRGQQPYPTTSAQNMLEVVDTLIGVLVFATIIGSVGSVITQMNRAMSAYYILMDAMKLYMNYRKVGAQIQERVLSCFMYMNNSNKYTDEQETLDTLPPKMQLDLAEHLHLETLKGISIFNECSSGFLADVVLLMKQQVFMPGDVVCRVGDNAKAMIIVKSGTLQVVDQYNTLVQEISDGATFGEMSIIHIAGNPMGDKRLFGLRSLGYSYVFILNQDDVLPVLSEYPEERVRLNRNAHAWLRETGDEYHGEQLEHGLNDPAVIFSVEEQLEMLQNAMSDMDNQLSNMYMSFRHSSNNMKKRVTALEETMWYGRDKIKRDMFMGKL